MCCGACARGAVCRLTAVPASEAAHARPAELLASEKPRKFPFNTIPNQSQFQCFSHPCASFRTSSILVASIRMSSILIVSICILASMCTLSCSVHLQFGTVTSGHSDLQVSCAAEHMCTHSAACCLMAVPASEAAHVQPAELLICIVVLLALLVPA